MSEHLGMLGFLSEANDIKEEMGVSFDEALKVQRDRADERQAQRQAAAESNVIPFRRK